jgi:MFS family permease
MSTTAPSTAAMTTTEKRLSTTAALICLIIFASAYITNAMDRQIFPMLLTWISRSYQFDLKEAGLLSTVFTLGIGIAAWPTGYLLDRRPRKTILMLGMVIYSVFTLATIFAFSFYDMLIYRSITGVGEAMQIAALFAAAGSYFYKNKALVIGTINLGYGIGGFVGPYYGTRLTIATDNWHVPFIIYAALGLVLAAVIWIFIPKTFSESKGPVTATAVDEALIGNMPRHFWNRNLILISIVAGTWGFCIFGWLGLYSTFMIQQLHYAPTVAGAAFGMYGIGAMLGIPCGWLGDRFSHRWVNLISWVATMVVWYLTYNVAVEPWAHYTLSFLVGLFASSAWYPNALSLAQRSVRPEFVGRATGHFASVAYLVATFAGWVFGWLIQRIGWEGASWVQLEAIPLIAIVALLLMKNGELFHPIKGH